MKNEDKENCFIKNLLYLIISLFYIVAIYDK